MGITSKKVNNNKHGQHPGIFVGGGSIYLKMQPFSWGVRKIILLKLLIIPEFARFTSPVYTSQE